MSKILVNQIANYGDNAPIEIKEGLNIPAGRPIQANGISGVNGQVLTSTGSSVQWTTPFNGDYNSLTNTPSIPAAQVNSDWNATSGVARILNKPVVPPQPSVTTNAAGTAALSYNSVNGQFTYTPPDLTGYATTAAVANSGNWDTAYGWGDHAAVGYVTAEADTLQTVTSRGATTNQNITIEDDRYLYFGTHFHLRNRVFSGTFNHGEITHTGDSLTIQSNNFVIDAVGGVNMLDATGGGAVSIYYNGNKKFETTTEGVTITGSVGNNNLTVEGDALVNGGLTAGGLSYPEVTGNAGQVLTSDGAGNVLWSAAGGGGGGIALTDLSVTTNAAGSAALTYNNVSGVFTYTPPDLSGYLTSFTETDPVFSISPAASISTVQINNWNSAYSWGDHSGQGYLTSYTETDTLATVTGRGATTSSNLTFSGTLAVNNTINIADDVVANFGAGLDGRISYTSSTNRFYVRVPGGTGDLILGAGPAVRITSANGLTDRAVFTSTGATITGALTAGGLTYPTTNGTSGQVLTSDGAGNVVWGAAATGNTQVTISDTLPGGTPTAGDLWWESDTGRLKIYYQDTDGAQWVDTNPPLADTNNPAAKGFINMNGSSPTWTGTAGYTVAHSGGGGLDELYTLTFPTAYSARTDYIVNATYDGTDWVYTNGAQVAVARFTDKVIFTVRRWNEDPLNLGDIMVTIHNL